MCHLLLFVRHWRVHFLDAVECHSLTMWLMWVGVVLLLPVATQANKADKRAHHNALERKRRDHIKDSFTVLRDAIPSLTGEKVGSIRVRIALASLLR
jgi:hypothetical protein